MPPRLLRGAGWVGDLVKRFVDFDHPLTYEAMSLATRSLPYDSSDAVRARRRMATGAGHAGRLDPLARRRRTPEGQARGPARTLTIEPPKGR
jgi:hypothetical protein